MSSAESLAAAAGRRVCKSDLLPFPAYEEWICGDFVTGQTFQRHPIKLLHTIEGDHQWDPAVVICGG